MKRTQPASRTKQNLDEKIAAGLQQTMAAWRAAQLREPIDPAALTGKVSLSLDGKGYGKVVIDGNDLSNYVKEIVVRSRAGHPTEVTLMVPWQNITGNVKAKVNVDASQIPDDIAALLYLALRQRFFKSGSSPAEQPRADGGDAGAL